MHIFKSAVPYLITAFILLLLSLVAIQPFLHGRMLLTDDGTLHLYRTIVLDHSLRYDGAIYPRYSSALAYGYGAPLFNYFSPIAYLLPRTLHVLGISFIHAWLAAMVCYLWLAMWGAFLLGKVWTGWIGGMVCAVSYLYAPYILYDAVSRGTITEVAALAMLPMVLWALTLIARHPHWRTFGVAVGAYAFFVPLHNIVTLHGSLLIGAYSLLLVAKSKTRRLTLLQLASVGIFGLLLTAFFWLPALGETQYVKINQVTDNLPSLDVANHLRPLSEVLALPVPVDPRQQQALIPITVSWISLIVGLIAIPLSHRYRRELFSLAIFWWIVVLLMLFMNTEASAWFWKSIPLLKYTQFAWRTLGIASLGLSVLVAIFVASLFAYIPSITRQNAILAILVALTIGYGFSFTYRPFLDIQAETVQDAQEYERQRGEVGLASYSEYLPITNSTLLNGNQLKPLWEQDNVIPRLESSNAFAISDEAWSGTSGAFIYQSDVDGTLTFNWLWMPGFVATLDNMVLDTVASSGEGLVQVTVPSGEHMLRVGFEGTALQHLASAISVIGFILFLGVCLMWRLRVKSVVRFGAERLPMASVWTLASVGIFCLGLKLLVIDQTNNMFHQNRFAGVNTLSTANFNNQLQLLSHSLPTISSQAVSFSAYWSLYQQPIPQKLAAQYSLRNSQGIIIAKSDSYQIAGLDTPRWLSGLYLEDQVTITIPDYTTPGNYTLEVNAFDLETLAPLSTINAIGNLDIPTVLLSNLMFPRTENTIVTPNPTDENLSIKLVSELPSQIMVGDELTFELIYTVGNDYRPPDSVQLVWRDKANKATSIETAACGDFDPLTWSTGEIWRCYLTTFVPATLEANTYIVELSLYIQEETIASLVFGETFVETPQRLLEKPESIFTSQAKWSNGIELVGYTWNENSIELVWRTDKLLDESLHIFVHVVDSNGTLLAQANGIPKEWTRPTTSWTTDEYIVTNYSFEELSNMQNRIEVGYYIPTSYVRIPLEDGQDSLVLTR